MSIAKSTTCSHDIGDHYLTYVCSSSSTQILHCTEEKDMGVVFDINLSFRNHISMSINEANKLLGIIRRSFCALDNTTFTLIYKAIVQSHLEYAVTIWNPYKKGYIDDLENVQRRATKHFQNISHLIYPDRLVALNLPTLTYCRMRGDMIKTFKILNNIYDSSVTNFLKKNQLFNNKGKSLESVCATCTLQHQIMVFLNLYCRHLKSSSFKHCKCTKRYELGKKIQQTLSRTQNEVL